MQDPHVDVPFITEFRNDPQRRSSACSVFVVLSADCLAQLLGTGGEADTVAARLCICCLVSAYLVLLLIKEALEELGLEHSAAVFNQEIGIPVRFLP